MVLVRRIRKRGANIVVEAHGEVLFSAVGPVGRWTNMFSNRVTAFTAEEAPENKRPRWAHYGKPLKSTITSSTTYQPVRMKVYSAVGSTAPHAYYVDQGTGIYAGNGPYEAKILPPWQRGSASLYERTWRPSPVEGRPGPRRVKPVMVKGQRGQFFFDEGLRRGFQSMRMRSFQVPTDAKITDALRSMPTGMTNFLGNTPPDKAFRAQLEEWRQWRDDAWFNDEGLARMGGIRQPRQAKYVSQAKSTRATTPKSTKKPQKQTKPKKGAATLADKKDRAVAQFRKQNPGIKILERTGYGIRVQTRSGDYLIRWDQLFNLID